MPLAYSWLGRYQLLHQLGSSTQGTIYLARDSQMSSQVALKIFHLNDGSQNNHDVAVEKREEFFRSEIQTIAQLAHPRILSICDSGTEKIDTDTYAYVAMNYYSAGSLQDWLDQTSSTYLSLSVISHVLSQAAEALHYAHEHGVVHQDLKPSNLLLRAPSSQPELLPDLLLADFGVARLFSIISGQGLSQSLYIRSTHMSLAPEQWDGKAVPASDQYALAILAFRLLTGQFPFQGTLSQIIHQHYKTIPPAPSSLNPQLDPSVDQIIQRALAKEPARRFPSMLEFAHAFAQLKQASDDKVSNSMAIQSAQAETLILEQPPIYLSPALAATAPGLATPTPPAPEATDNSADQTTLLALEATDIPADQDASLDMETTDCDDDPETLPMLNEAASAKDEPIANIVPVPVSEAADVMADLTILASSDQTVSLAEAYLQDILSAPTISLLTHETQTSAAGDSPAALADDLVARNDLHSYAASDSPATMPASDLVTRANAYPGAQAPTLLKVAPPLPIARIAPPLPPLNLPATPQRKVSLLRKSLLVGLLALLILGGGSALLLASFTGHTYGSTSTPGGNGSSARVAQPGQTSPASTGVTIIITTTPTAGDAAPATTPGTTSTPAAGSAPAAGSTPAAGTTPSTASTPQVQPTPTPTPRPTPTPTPTPRPAPTPTPTPHPCLIHYWTLTLTTYSKGGHALYVSSYCHGVVYLTLTQAPASAGHKVYLQICYALNSTNCTGWVAYSSPNVWLTMATGLKTNQVFYINGKCSGCTSQFVMYGAAKY